MLYPHEGRLPDGSPFRVSALYVLYPPARGLPVQGALVSLFHAFLVIFRGYSVSGCIALALRPLGGSLAGAGLPAVPNLSAIQLAAGCLPADALRILRSRPLEFNVLGGLAERPRAGSRRGG